MKQERQVLIGETEYIVIISDEPEALLAARAAGSAVVGLWEPGMDKDYSMVSYLIERIEDLDGQYLEQVVRRTFGLPLQIAGTGRLVIRELQLSDLEQIPTEAEDQAGHRIFRNHDTLAAYIEHQYGFFGYGYWGLEDRGSGRLIGIAGVTGITGDEYGDCLTEESLELGYHIFTPYRRRGYALEACRAIITYVKTELGAKSLHLKTDASNSASVHLAKRLDFILVQKDNQQMTELYLLSLYCSKP